MWSTRRGLAALVIALGLLTAACSGGEAPPAAPSASGPGEPRTAPGSLAPSSAAFRAARVRLVPVATMQQPVAMAVRPGDQALYVAEQTGRVRAIRNGRLDPAP